MFRRSKTESSVPTTEQAQARSGAKGRPTPSRREAEAAAKARAKAPRTRKEQARAQRTSGAESSRQVRAAMKAGDERYYLPRDQGPVRRFVRDFVDSRIGFSELLAPMLVVVMVLGYGAAGPSGQSLATALWYTTIFLVVADILWLRFRLRRAVAERFPEEGVKGVTWYAVMRAINLRFLRLPKPQKKIGQALDERYR